MLSTIHPLERYQALVRAHQETFGSRIQQLETQLNALRDEEHHLIQNQRQALKVIYDVLGSDGALNFLLSLPDLEERIAPILKVGKASDWNAQPYPRTSWILPELAPRIGLTISMSDYGYDEDYEYDDNGYQANAGVELYVSTDDKNYVELVGFESKAYWWYQTDPYNKFDNIADCMGHEALPELVEDHWDAIQEVLKGCPDEGPILMTADPRKEVEKRLRSEIAMLVAVATEFYELEAAPIQIGG